MRKRKKGGEICYHGDHEEILRKAQWLLSEKIAVCLSGQMCTGLYKYNSVNLGLCPNDPVPSFTRAPSECPSQRYKKSMGRWKGENLDLLRRVPSRHGTCGMKPGLLCVLTYKSLIPGSAPIRTSLGLSWGCGSQVIGEPHSLYRLRVEFECPSRLLKSSFSLRLPSQEPPVSVTWEESAVWKPEGQQIFKPEQTSVHKASRWLFVLLTNMKNLQMDLCSQKLQSERLGNRTAWDSDGQRRSVPLSLHGVVVVVSVSIPESFAINAAMGLCTQTAVCLDTLFADLCVSRWELVGWQ